MLTNTPFSMQAYIGVIMLAGIVVSNAILLVDYTNTLRHRDKMALRPAIELAGRQRLRPILMTSTCTGLGLVPMALGIGEGAELQAPLARVVIGGLLTSTTDHAGVRAGDVYAVRRRVARNLQDVAPPRTLKQRTNRLARYWVDPVRRQFVRAARARRAAREISGAAPPVRVRSAAHFQTDTRSRSSVSGRPGRPAAPAPLPLDGQQVSSSARAATARSRRRRRR